MIKEFLPLLLSCLLLTGCVQNSVEEVTLDDVVVSAEDIPEIADESKTNLDLAKDGYVRLTPKNDEPFYYNLLVDDDWWKDLKGDDDNYLKAMHFLNNCDTLLMLFDSVQAKAVFYGDEVTYDDNLFATTDSLYVSDDSTRNYRILKDNVYTVRDSTKDVGQSYCCVNGTTYDVITSNVNELGLGLPPASEMLQFSKTDKDDLYYISYALNDEDMLDFYSQYFTMDREHMYIIADVFVNSDLIIQSYRIRLDDPLQSQPLKEVFYAYNLEEPNFDLDSVYKSADFENMRGVQMHIKDTYVDDVLHNGNIYEDNYEFSVPSFSEIGVIYPDDGEHPASIDMYDSAEYKNVFDDVDGTGDIEVWTKISFNEGDNDDGDND